MSSESEKVGEREEVLAERIDNLQETLDELDKDTKIKLDIIQKDTDRLLKRVNKFEDKFESDINDLNEKTKELESLKDWFISNSFQVSALISGVFIFIITLLVGMSNFGNFDDNYQLWIVLSLWLIAAILIVWIILWYKQNKK